MNHLVIRIENQDNVTYFLTKTHSENNYNWMLPSFDYQYLVTLLEFVILTAHKETYLGVQTALTLSFGHK
jgi:hypothetical protein